MVKQEVLAALDGARGQYISGQELAARLGVSRTAIWKAVAALRSDGIPIEAVTNRGYALAADADVLNAAAVEMDETARLDLYKQAQQILYIDDPAAVWTNDRFNIWATTSKVEGVKTNVNNVLFFDELRVAE